MEHLFKNFEYQIKSLDEPKGIVQMYVNAFNNKDADGDISAPGSFKKTIKENFNRIKHLLNHDTWQLLGLPLEMKEDDFGLLVTSQMNIKKQLVKDVFEDYKLFADHNRSLEHSIRVEALKRDPEDEAIVKEWRLWEYSTLYSWGANAKTPMVSIKSLDDLELMIKKGHYSDEKSRQIEELYYQLKRLMQPGALEDEPPTTDEAVKLFLNQIKI